MTSPDFNRQRLEELLLSSASRAFPEAERVELNALLRDNPEARILAARSLTFDASLADCLIAAEARREQSKPLDQAPIQVDFKRPNWLAKAAVWIGAFHLLGNTAKAGGTISSTTSTTLFTQSTIFLLMKKAVTSITAAILVLGGSGIYVIHRSNESSRARVAEMETQIQTLSDELGIKSTRSASSRAAASNSQKTVGITQVIAIYSGDNIINMQESAAIEQFENQLTAMDVESLKNMLLDAEKINNPINGRVAETIMEALIAKDPAEASRIASQLIGRGLEFQYLLSRSAEKAFKAWLAKDPAAADAWYVATAAAGGLNSKTIAPNGLEEFAIDRTFACLRLAAQSKTNPSEAAAMLATMLPADVTKALQEVNDPDALRLMIPKLSPAQKGPAAEGVIKAMAASDLNAAFTWAKSLEMDDLSRNALMATGIEEAVKSGKLDLAGVSERSKDLNLDPERRSEMLVSAATSVSSIPRKKPGTIDPENSVHWDQVPDRIDWLRKEAPSESASEIVGKYLGRLAHYSHNPDQSFKALEQEAARQGNPDPALTIAFAKWAGLWDSERFIDKSLEHLRKLPASEERDNAIEMIEINR